MIYINGRPASIITKTYPLYQVISTSQNDNKEIYSNYNVENPNVHIYNSAKYIDSDICLNGPSSGNTRSKYKFDSYIYTNNITHRSGSNTQFSEISGTGITNHLDDFGEARKTKYFPNPITIRTDFGKTIKFYENYDFSNPVWTSDCVYYYRQLEDPSDSSSSKRWYQSPSYGFTKVYNLIPGVTYQYKVFDANDNAITGIYKTDDSYGEFTVQGQIRQIRLNGAVNVRDSGGYITNDNKRVKYGKIIRGSQLQYGFGNDDTTGAYNVTARRRWVDGYDSESTSEKVMGGIDADALKEIKNLGITLDMDLRDKSDTYKKDANNPIFVKASDDITVNGQIVDDGVEYYSISNIVNANIQAYYAVRTTTIGKQEFALFVSKLAETLQSGGTAYVHCQQGRDRTGTFMAFLFALLGIKDDGILKDYELTSYLSYDGDRWSFQYGTDSGGPLSTITIPTSNSDIRTYLQNWFKTYYNSLTNNTYRIKYKDSSNNDVYLTDADQAMEYLRGLLLESNTVSTKTIAVIGDSQSAFRLNRQGFTPANMWWYQSAESIGVNPSINLNNSSFGESRVAYSNSKSVRACSLERLQSIKVNGKNPDFIFIMMGGNDWGKGSNIGVWNVGDQLPIEYDQNGNELNLNFKPAYALMLSRISNLYPESKVVCITQPLLNMKYTGGKSFKDWMEAIIDIAKKFNLPVIDLYKLCGQTIWKEAEGNDEDTGQDASEPAASSKYISDSWVHLNPLGQQYIADKINAELQKILYPHMAIIGDSISAYKEYTSNRRYGCEYPKTTNSNGTSILNPVSSPTQMWWYKVSQYLGYNGRVINAACSGTTVCKNNSYLSNKEIPNIRGLSDVMVDDLYVNPDKLEVIIVATGLNDYRLAVPIGSWNVGDPYPDESASTIDFKPGYALLLHKLQTRYPKAKIYCCNLYKWYGSPSNSENYRDAVEDIAAKFGCTVIDSYTQCSSAFNKSSSPATYMLPDATHPNAEGQQYIADVVIEKLQQLNT